MYGAQTENVQKGTVSSFENDVEMYGAQTISPKELPPPKCLRMM